MLDVVHVYDTYLFTMEALHADDRWTCHLPAITNEKQDERQKGSSIISATAVKTYMEEREITRKKKLPTMGIEPTTTRLKAGRSTSELRWRCYVLEVT
jgi:hypothetical protein